MKKTKRQYKSGKTALQYFVVLICIVLILSLFAFVIDGDSKIKNMYLQIGDQIISSNAAGYSISVDSPLLIDVCYIFQFENMEYTVSVEPIKELDFVFTVDDSAYVFNLEKEYTAGFNIVRKNTGFEISPVGSFFDVLRACFNGAEVNYDHSQVDPSQDMFTLVVTSSSGEIVTVDFSVSSNEYDIVLSPDSIVF